MAEEDNETTAGIAHYPSKKRRVPEGGDGWEKKVRRDLCIRDLPEEMFLTVFSRGNVNHALTPLLRLVCKKWSNMFSIFEPNYYDPLDLTFHLAREGHSSVLDWALRQGAQIHDDIVGAAFIRSGAWRGAIDLLRSLRVGCYSICAACSDGSMVLLDYISRNIHGHRVGNCFGVRVVSRCAFGGYQRRSHRHSKTEHRFGRIYRGHGGSSRHL